jgi:hypothetical protein
MNSMNLRCTTDKVSTSSPHYQIIKDIDVILELQRPSDDKEHKYPEIKVYNHTQKHSASSFSGLIASPPLVQISGNISSIEVSLTDSQFTMLLGIWKENMLEGPNALDDDRTSPTSLDCCNCRTGPSGISHLVSIRSGARRRGKEEKGRSGQR